LIRRLLLASLFALTAVPATQAQVFEPSPRLVPPPTRTVRTVNPNRPTQTLGLRLDLLGGYDRNEVPPAPSQPTQQTTVAQPTVNFRPSSYRGSGTATLRYQRSTASRSLNLGGSGGANIYSSNGYANVSGAAPGPIYSSSANGSFTSSLGRKNTLALTQSVSRSPYMAFGLFNQQTAGTIVYDADGNPVNNLIDGYTIAVNSTASLGRSWARGASTTVTYGYQRRTDERSAVDLYQNDHSGTLSYVQSLGRSIGFNLSYHVANRQAQQVGLERHDVVHGVTGGMQARIGISRSRALTLAGGGGADLIDVAGFANRYWQPNFYGNLGVDIGRSWVVSAHYSQASSVVNSPISTPDSYLTQSGVLSTSGGIGRRVDVVVNAGFTSGNVDAVHSVAGASGDFTGVTGAAQVRTALTSRWSLLVGVNYYRSELSGAASQFLQTPSDFQRTSVRLGMSWSIPLYDTTPR